MQKNQNISKIAALLAEACHTDIKKIETAKEQDSLASIGLTSIAFISFVVKLEKEFDIEINDRDLVFEKFETLKALYKTLSAYIEIEKPSPITALSEIKKCLILDCDNVLWKGIAGEEETVIDQDVLKLHRILCSLHEQGIILCLCSKSKAEITEGMFNRKDIGISLSMFSVTKINRNNKAENIKEIISELNIGRDSIVFVDDSDYELGYISVSLPETELIKADWTDTSFIDKIKNAFQNTPNSALNRAELYREQKEREKEKSSHISVEEYNASLQTTVICREAEKEDIPRISELSIRTNQFNLSDSHYSEEEIKAFYSSSEYITIIISAKDRYGDMGIVGSAVVRRDVIEAFMISCRVFDREFEKILLDKLKTMSSTPLKGIYKSNGKNAEFSNFYTENGIEVI